MTAPGPPPKGVRPEGVRPEGVRPEGVRPEGVRPEGVRPDGVRPEGVRRIRTGAVLGGVCAGVARSAGLDPLLLRVAVVAVTLLTGGAAVLAYLAAWVLVPREESAPDPALPAGPAPPGRAGVPGSAGDTGEEADVPVRAAWTAAGHDLRSLAAELRRPAPEDPAPDDPAPPAATEPPAQTTAPEGGVPAPRSPLTAADDAATAFGERLRAPEVQAGARKAAASVTEALNASVDELGRRIRRDPG